MGYDNYLLESDQYPAEQLLKRCEEAILKLAERLLTEAADGNVFLTDWENYQYDF